MQRQRSNAVEGRLQRRMVRSSITEEQGERLILSHNICFRCHVCTHLRVAPRDFNATIREKPNLLAETVPKYSLHTY